MKGKVSNAQLYADRVVQWSINNRVQLNTDKCKELRISFAKNKQEFVPISVNGEDLKIVKSVKLLRLNITSCNSWVAQF